MLYIFEQKYFLSEYILEGLTPSKDIRVIQYCKLKPKGLGKIIHKIKKYIRAFIYNKQGLWVKDLFADSLTKGLSQISEGDSVLFWGCENLKDIVILQKEIHCKKLNFYRWNPMYTKSLLGKLEFKHYTKKYNLNICTFDAGDAALYHQKHVNQVFRANWGGNFQNAEFDVFFVGQDKNRAGTLLTTSRLLRSQDISYKFHIQPDKHTKTIPSELAECFSEANMPYREVIKNIECSRCLLEVLQEGQTGISMRTLEAIFFRKKLITNNIAIKTLPFYNKQNIFILGDNEEMRSIKDFMNSDIVDIPKEITDPYEINHWVKQFQ